MSARPPPHRPIAFTLTDIKPRPHRWLWPGRIPLGKLTFLSGDPGVGKSRLAADLAARATAGLPWPDGQPNAGPVDVMLFCAEDEPADTLRPRIAAAGGDLSRAHALRPAVFPDGYVAPILFPRDCRYLERPLIGTATPRLILFDPLAAYLGPAGDSGSEIQSRLLPLLDFAERNDVAILAVTHRDLRPQPAGRRCATNLAHLAAARVAFHLEAEGPLHPDVRRLRTIKNNLAPAGPALSFRMHAETLEWLPPMPDAPPPPSERVLAAEWLLDLLKNGPVAASDALVQANAALFCHKTLRRVFRELGVRVHRKGYQGPWQWELQTAQTATPENDVHH
jgi:putative DNA primase/helicase